MTQIAAEAVLSMAMVLFGAPTEFALRSSDLPSCKARDRTAHVWQQEKRPVFLHQIKPWCIVASIHRGAWHAEQWMDVGAHSHGWKIKVPFSSLPHGVPAQRQLDLAPGVSLSLDHHPGLTLEQAHTKGLRAFPDAPAHGHTSRHATTHGLPTVQGSGYRIDRWQGLRARYTLLTFQADAQPPAQILLTEAL